MKKNIIICGYPKSGNTWLTRLTGEIVGCPVVGFWLEPLNKEPAIEGLERKSDFQCFKAHHDSNLLHRTLKLYGRGDERILYIYRDPRDVVVSAAAFFRLQPRFRRAHYLIGWIPFLDRLHRQLLQTTAYRQSVLTKGIVHGTNQGAWLTTPWRNHVEGFLDQGDRVLALRYEDLCSAPLETARRICDFLRIEKTDEELSGAIHEQSFAVKKRRFEDEGVETRAAILRQGRFGNWKYQLPEKNVRYIEDHLGSFMERVQYPVSNANEKS